MSTTLTIAYHDAWLFGALMREVKAARADELLDAVGDMKRVT